MFKCRICGETLEPDTGLEHEIEKHLREKHFMSYSEYYELTKTSDPGTEVCCSCG